MANRKLTQLPALASLSADDLFYVVDDPAGAATSNKMTASVLDAKYLKVASNLSDLANAATARTNLGLVAGGAGDIWVEKAGDTMTGLLNYAQPAASDGNKFYCVDPNDPNAALFNWHVWESNNVSGRRNTGINWGYNQTAGGGVETAGESAFWQQIETYYVPGAVAQMEYHWNFTPAGGSNVRPFHLNMHIDGAGSGYHDAYWYLDRMTWLDRTNQTFVAATLTIGTAATDSSFVLGVPLSFSGTTNSGIRLNNLTTTQRNALTAANGMVIYNTTDGQVQGYVAGVWGSIGGSSLPVVDTTSIVMGSADNTKLLRFEVDGFSAGATRVMTPPNQDTLLAGQNFSNVFTVAQTIALATDTTHLIIRNHSTHTTPQILFEKSDGTDLFMVFIDDLMNTFLGKDAGIAGISGIGNVGIGEFALSALTSGHRNMGIGPAALRGVTTGQGNVALGQSSGQAITTGSGNFALGTSSLLSLVSGDGNIAIGANSGLAVTSTNCILVGETAGPNITSGTANIGFGYNVLSSLITGGENVAFGRSAGTNVTGWYTLSFGAESGAVDTTRYDNSIALGVLARFTAANQLVVGSFFCPITDAYFGSGVTYSAPTDIAINAGGGSGTDIAGASLTLAGGKPTGSGAGGSIILKTAPAGATGTALRALVTRLTLDSTGLITLADVVNFAFNTGTGTKFGTATGQKMGFWNVAPVIQPAHANQAALTNSSGGTYDGTLAAISGTGADAAINNNFTDIFTLLDAMRTAMVNSGMMKGAA